MDRYGNLSEAELAAVKERLSTSLKSACWNCAQQDWLIFPTVLGEAFYDGAGQFMTAAHVGPKIRLTCRNCGNIAYFSAEALGVETEAQNG